MSRRVTFERTIMRSARFSLLFALSILGLGAHVACSSSTSSGASPSADGGGADGSTGGEAGTSGDGGSVSAKGSDTCAQSLTCVAECPDNDQACIDKCDARASTAGATKLVALANCLDAQKCADATCAKAKCGPELDACLNDVSSGGTTTTPPAGAQTPLPSTLVGTWDSISSSIGFEYVFAADGKYTATSVYQAGSTCLAISKLVTSIDGVAAVDGSTLTLTPTHGSQSTTDCGGTTKDKTTSPSPRTFTWSVSGTKLTLTDDTGSLDYAKQ